MEITTQKELIPAPDRGPSVRGPQDWDSLPDGYQFYCGAAGEKYLDVVVRNSQYYECKASHTKAAARAPGASGWEAYWTLATKLEIVATQILLATYALVKNLGVEAIEMKDSNNNILFEAKNGNVTCNTGTFENVTVKGVIKVATLYGETLKVTNGTRNINPLTDKTTCYYAQALPVNYDAVLVLPDPTTYDGLELQFFHIHAMRNAEGDLQVKYSSYIWYNDSTLGYMTTATTIHILVNQLVTLKAMQGYWYVVSGNVEKVN